MNWLLVVAVLIAPLVGLVPFVVVFRLEDRGREYPRRTTRRASTIVPVPYKRALQEAAHSAYAIGGEAVEVDPTLGRITAKTDGTWRSCGLILRIEVAPNEDGTTRVDAATWPRMPTTLIDLGAGTALLNRFFAALVGQTGCSEPA